MSENSVILYKNETIIQSGEKLSNLTVSSSSDGDFLSIIGGGTAFNITMAQGGSCSVLGGTLSDFVANGGVINISEGYGKNLTINSGTTVYVDQNNNTFVENITVAKGATLSVFNGSINNLTTLSGARLWLYGGTFTDSLFCNGLKLSFYAPITITGILKLECSLNSTAVINAANGEINVNLSVIDTSKNPAIASWQNITANILSITITEDLSPASYKLAGKASAFDSPVVIRNQDGKQIATIKKEGATAFSDKLAYRLNTDSNALLTVEVEESHTLELNTNTLQNTALVKTFGNQASLFMKNSMEASWNESINVTVTTSGDAAEFKAIKDNITDVFLATSTGPWKAGFSACNTHTGELMPLAGLNRYEDIFIGACDDAILLLSDMDDAIFGDDIYTNSPAETNTSRLTNLTEIRAGAGNDVIDMTSIRLDIYNADIVLYGGDGNDTLWAPDQGAKLFGDNGNDHIAGGAGNDILVGGAGDDILNGVGGQDIYAFCKNWGHDCVLLDGNSDFRLWFDDDIQLSMEHTDNSAIITDGTNSVTIITDDFESIENKILVGNADGQEFNNWNYEVLKSIGAFQLSSSF